MKKIAEREYLEAYESYADGIFRFCYFKTSDREVAKDIVQQVFLQTWNYVVKGEEIENFQPLLYRIARNAIIDWYRKKRPSSLETMAEDGFDPPDKAMGTEELAEFSWSMETLKKLPKDEQEIIIWRYIEGLSPKEIAKILNERENTVSVRIHRAIANLKELLSKNHE